MGKLDLFFIFQGRTKLRGVAERWKIFTRDLAIDHTLWTIFAMNHYQKRNNGEALGGID